MKKIQKLGPVLLSVLMVSSLMLTTSISAMADETGAIIQETIAGNETTSNEETTIQNETTAAYGDNQNKVIEKVLQIPGREAAEFMEKVIDATIAYDKLTTSEQNGLPKNTMELLEKSQSDAANINHFDEDTNITIISKEVPWYVKIDAKAANPEKMQKALDEYLFAQYKKQLADEDENSEEENTDSDDYDDSDAEDEDLDNEDYDDTDSEDYDESDDEDYTDEEELTDEEYFEMYLKQEILSCYDIEFYDVMNDRKFVVAEGELIQVMIPEPEYENNDKSDTVDNIDESAGIDEHGESDDEDTVDSDENDDAYISTFYKIVHLSSDNKIELMDTYGSTTDENKVVLDGKDYPSQYGLINDINAKDDKAVAESTGEDISSPKTQDSILFVLVIDILAIGMLAGILIRRKKNYKFK